MAGSQNGSLVLLLIKVFGNWRIIGGQRSYTDTLNTNPIDITNKASDDFRELLEGEGLLTRDITLELFYNSDANYQRLRELSKTRELTEFRILRSDTGYNDDFTAIVSNFTEAAPMGEAVSNTVTLSPSTSFTWGLYNPMPPIIILQPANQDSSIGESVTFLTKAINWKTCQWYRIGPPDHTGVRPEPVEIVGETNPNLTLELTFEDMRSLFYIVYTNDAGSTQSDNARIIGEVIRAAVSNIFPIRFEDSMTSEASFWGQVKDVAVNYDRSPDVLESTLHLYATLEEPTVEHMFHDSLDSTTTVTATLKDVTLHMSSDDAITSMTTLDVSVDKIGVILSTEDELTSTLSISVTLE